MKKISLFLMTVLVLFLLGACKNEESKQPEPQPEPVPDPELTIAEEIITVDAAGGMVELPYLVTNPVDGAVITVTSDMDWVSGFDYETVGKVTMEVAPNMGNEDRNANLLLKYAYGDGQSIEKQLIVHQYYQYDYHTDVQCVNAGYFAGTQAPNANYMLYFSDMEVAENGNFSPGSTVFRIDLYSDQQPEDYTKITMPEGVFTREDIVVTSFYGKVNADGSAWEENFVFEDITVTVSYEEDLCVIEGVATYNEGIVHHFICRQDISMGLYSKEGYGLITYDIETVDTFLSSISYIADNGEVMAVHVQLSGTPENGDYMNPFTSLYLEFVAPYDNYKLLPGTYTVSNSQAAYTILPGSVDPSTLSLLPTYAFYTHGMNTAVALISEGTVVVEENADGTYTLDCELFTEQGFAVTSHYEGELEIPNSPGSGFSTLDGDYTVDMTDINPFCIYWGDSYENGGGYYVLELTGPFEQNPDTYMADGTGEAVYFEFVSEAPEDPSKAIPTGVYTVAADKDAPNPGEFIPGYQSQLGQGVLSGTRYVGAWEAGFISRCAPAVGGELEITNHGDGTYTIKFAFLDDLGNTWDGEWTGAMSVLDFSSFSPEQRAAKMADLGRL